MLLTQADMFDPTVAEPAARRLLRLPADRPGDRRRVVAFDGPVYLFNGDSHVYNTDQPLAAGSPWLVLLRRHGAADNLTRVTVDGSTNVKDYLRVTVRPSRQSC